MIKTIVFDLGGVLIRLNREEALKRFEALGVPNVEEMLDPYLQSGYFLEVEDGRMTEQEFRSALSKLSGRTLSYDDIMNAYLGFLEEIPQYKFDFIDELRKEYTVHILSNTNPYVMDFAESPDFLPNHRPLSSYCDHKFASCEMGVVKPHRAIFEQMIEEAQLTPSETLFIDDGPANIKTANELGFVTYCPENGADWREDIQAILQQHNSKDN